MAYRLHPTRLARLSQLSVWFIKLGIYPELIEPGKPQQNGVHETDAPHAQAGSDDPSRQQSTRAAAQVRSISGGIQSGSARTKPWR